MLESWLLDTSVLEELKRVLRERKTKMGTYDTRGGYPRHDPMFDEDPPCDGCGKDPYDCECILCHICESIPCDCYPEPPV